MQKAHVFEGMGFLLFEVGWGLGLGVGFVQKVIKKCCESVDELGFGL